MKNISISKKSLMALVFISLISSANAERNSEIFNSSIFTRGVNRTVKIVTPISKENLTETIDLLIKFIADKNNVGTSNTKSVKEVLEKVQEVIENNKETLTLKQKEDAQKLFSIARENNIAGHLSLTTEEIEAVQKTYADTLKELQEEIAQNKTVTPETKAKLISLWGKMKQAGIKTGGFFKNLFGFGKKEVDLDATSKLLKIDNSPEGIAFREQLDEAAKVKTPVEKAAEKAGLTSADYDEIESTPLFSVSKDFWNHPTMQNTEGYDISDKEAETQGESKIKAFVKNNWGKLTATAAIATMITLNYYGIANLPDSSTIASGFGKLGRFIPSKNDTLNFLGKTWNTTKSIGNSLSNNTKSWAVRFGTFAKKTVMGQTR